MEDIKSKGSLETFTTATYYAVVMGIVLMFIVSASYPTSFSGSLPTIGLFAVASGVGGFLATLYIAALFRPSRRPVWLLVVPIVLFLPVAVVALLYSAVKPSDMSVFW